VLSLDMPDEETTFTYQLIAKENDIVAFEKTSFNLAHI
jgi:hypothetical protein